MQAHTQIPVKGLLLDIDKTLIDKAASQFNSQGGKLAWLGGGPTIWRECLLALRKLGLNFVGLATLRQIENWETKEIERELKDFLDPGHSYFRPEDCNDKAIYALAPAAKKSGALAKHLCLLEDQRAICQTVKEAGYQAVCVEGVYELKVKTLTSLRQQIKIVESFQKIAEQLGFPPSEILAVRLLELKTRLVKMKTICQQPSSPRLDMLAQVALNQGEGSEVKIEVPVKTQKQGRKRKAGTFFEEKAAAGTQEDEDSSPNKRLKTGTPAPAADPNP